MLKRTLSVMLTITALFALSACSLWDGNTTTENETVTTVDTTKVTAEEDTFETQDSDDSPIMSDEEVINLFNQAEYTSREWLGVGFALDNDIKKEPIYREYANSKLMPFYPLGNDTYMGLTQPDIALNQEIHYGDYDWMQTHLRKIYTEKYIEKYFTYSYPYTCIYENGVVYALPYTSQVGLGGTLKTYKNHTVIYKTENEIALICEVYEYDYLLKDYDYSQIDGLTYMKFVKVDDSWLIDEHYSEKAAFIMPNDRIPAEYFEKIPEKYRSMTKYFEGFEEDGVTEATEVDILGFVGLDWKDDKSSVTAWTKYVNKDEILDFDKNAVFKGPNRTFRIYGAQYSGFDILSTNCRLWGYDAFVEYSGRIKVDSESIVTEENAMYGTTYSYTGDGSDILFDPNMIITIPNVTYNDFVAVWENISSLADKSISIPQELTILGDKYGTDTVFTELDNRQVYIETMIAGTDWTISVQLVDEDSLSGSQNEGLNANPLTVPIYNRMKIHVNAQYRKS